MTKTPAFNPKQGTTKKTTSSTLPKASSVFPPHPNKIAQNPTEAQKVIDSVTTEEPER